MVVTFMKFGTLTHKGWINIFNNLELPIFLKAVAPKKLSFSVKPFSNAN